MASMQFYAREDAVGQFVQRRVRRAASCALASFVGHLFKVRARNETYGRCIGVTVNLTTG